VTGGAARPVGREPGRDAPRPPEPVFAPYGFTGEIPDPIARALNALLDEVISLRTRIGELEREREASDGRRGAAEVPMAEPMPDPVRRRVGAQP